MTDITARVIEIVAKRVPANLRHRVTPDAILSDLDLCPVDRLLSIPCDVSEEFGCDFTDDEIDQWRFVSDIITTVGLRRSVPA
jgi:acyl carrier protein